MKFNVDSREFESLPRYRQVRIEIERAIANGLWLPGEALPNEHQLAERFTTGIGTIRKAVGILVDDNILLREQGRGTFVARHNPDRTRFYFFNVVAKDGERRFPQREVLDFERGRADNATATALGLRARSGVFSIRIAQRLMGERVMIEYITVPAALFPGLTREHYLDYTHTIYGLYQQRFGVNVIRSNERIRATTVPDDDARMLNLPDAHPVLEISRLAFTFDEKPVEIRRSYVDTRNHDYLSELG